MTPQAVVVCDQARLRREPDGSGVIPDGLMVKVSHPRPRLVDKPYGNIAHRQMAFSAGKLLVPRCLPLAVDVFHAVAAPTKA